MRLVWFTVHGFRRFEEACDVQLDGHVVAVTGPNEAGKSSLLDALEHLNHTEPFTPGELTRRTGIPATQAIIRARFLVEKEDIEHVRHLNGGSEIRWLVVSKTREGHVRTKVEPPLERDFPPRDKALRALERLRPRVAKAAPLVSQEEGETGVEHLELKDLDEVIGYMRSREPRLTNDEHARFGSLIETLRRDVKGYGQTAARALSSAEATFEAERTHPNDEARRILFERRPTVLRFEDTERTLASEYDIIDQVPGLPQTAAVRNLASLAELDLEAIRLALEQEDYGLIDTLIRQANDRLQAAFKVSWRQSEVTVRFKTDERILRVLIESPHEAASQISERSDGMRAFIALLAYTAVKAGDGLPPILLIDEAETHLHYAAQADLVKVLTEQTAASQVI